MVLVGKKHSSKTTEFQPLTENEKLRLGMGLTEEEMLELDSEESDIESAVESDEGSEEIPERKEGEAEVPGPEKRGTKRAASGSTQTARRGKNRKVKLNRTAARLTTLIETHRSETNNKPRDPSYPYRV